MNIHAHKLRKIKKLDDAVAYTALHMGITDDVEIVKMMVLADNKAYSNRNFAKRLAENIQH